MLGIYYTNVFIIIVEVHVILILNMSYYKVIKI